VVRGGVTAVTYIRTEVSGAVARITLDDPGRRNILSGPLVAELTAAFDDVEGRGDVTAVVLTGAGPAFCAGADLADLLAGADGDPGPVRRVYGAFDRVRRSPLVTVAAVNGPAVGAGLNVALVCDLRIAAASAWFDCRFLGIGLHPGGGHLRMLQRWVGAQTAAAMVFAGRRLDAAAAHAVGLVLDVVADDELPPAADELAARIARAPRELVLATKRSLYEEADLTAEAAMDLEERRQMWSLELPSTALRLRALARR
jgi:enoyl-CoA hydratase